MFDFIYNLMFFPNQFNLSLNGFAVKFKIVFEFMLNVFKSCE